MFLISFRKISPFGRSTIRSFSDNVSDLSRLAARDYEDILQCCIPCFDGLFAHPHNETILDLLFLMNYWHSLAKLRMHTDSSLAVFREATVLLGDGLRYFALETCNHFDTVESDGEYQARSRAHARRVAKSLSATSTAQRPAAPGTLSTSTDADEPVVASTAAPIGGKRKKTFNVFTPKNHAFPDYPSQIEEFGTPDGFSTMLAS